MKKWIYLERKHTPRTEARPSQKVKMLGNMVWLVFMDWAISWTNEWEDYSSYFGEGAEIFRNWATAHFFFFTLNFFGV